VVGWGVGIKVGGSKRKEIQRKMLRFLQKSRSSWRCCVFSRWRSIYFYVILSSTSQIKTNESSLSLNWLAISAIFFKLNFKCFQVKKTKKITWRVLTFSTMHIHTMYESFIDSPSQFKVRQ